MPMELTSMKQYWQPFSTMRAMRLFSVMGSTVVFSVSKRSLPT